MSKAPKVVLRPLIPHVAIEEQLHIRLFASHAVPLGDWWKGPHASSFWRLYINNCSGATILFEGKPMELEAWRIYLVPAWVQFTSHAPGPIEHCYIHFEIVSLPATLIRDHFNRPVLLEREPRMDRMARWWARDMIAHRPHDLDILLRAKSLVYHALASLMRTASPETLERCSQHLLGQRAMLIALDYIEAHLGESLDNQLLAQLCHVSRDHFIRLFRRLIGQTPGQYILDRRVSCAAQRLVFGNESIEAIAEATGFLDRFHFSRVFAARMGIPPAKYRKTSMT